MNPFEVDTEEYNAFEQAMVKQAEIDTILRNKGHKDPVGSAMIITLSSERDLELESIING